jgi:hypothetical protein
MGAFDKTLEFIKNCSIEELTKELSGCGIRFTKKRKLSGQNQKTVYDEAMISVSKSVDANSALLKFYSIVQVSECYYSPDMDDIDLWNNTFVISQEEDAA